MPSSPVSGSPRRPKRERSCPPAPRKRPLTPSRTSYEANDVCVNLSTRFEFYLSTQFKYKYKFVSQWSELDEYEM